MNLDLLLHRVLLHPVEYRDRMLVDALRALDGDQLRAVLGRYMRLDDDAARVEPPLLERVRRFRGASLGGEYTEAPRRGPARVDASGWVALFGRHMDDCVRGSGAVDAGDTRAAFEMLFELLRVLDRRPDSIADFGDEAGSWQVGVDWRRVAPGYARALAPFVTATEFDDAFDRLVVDLVGPADAEVVRAAVQAFRPAPLPDR